MSRDLTFYTNPMSRGRIVRWMLEEVGQPYETKILDWPDLKTADYKAINPMGKVPAVRHGDVVITECAAICAYLADAFPEAGLAPAPQDPMRGPYYRWLFFAAGPLEAAVVNKALGFETPPEKRVMAGYGCYEDVLDTLEQAVWDGGWLAGDRFTAADLYVACHLAWGMQWGTIEKRPAFEKFAAQATARPAAERARELDDALMPARQPEPAA